MISEAARIPSLESPVYANTEGLWGLECERHEGIHLFEDAALLENVNEDGCPVPPGEPGARLLITSLYNMVQPVIRLEVSDVVTLEPGPCPCGRALVRTRAIEGRRDDVLELPGRNGGAVAVHPLQFALLTRDREVREFQVVQEGESVLILFVPRHSASNELQGRLREVVSRKLTELGVREPRLGGTSQEPDTFGERQTATRGRGFNHTSSPSRMT